ncbi:hypothetical protein DRW48_10520 [Paracoccus suum]|uniref:Bacteriophage tail tape measure N-terminal domain-containing protein n=1 Tax=Paracoccus suum TaxID=2259340 RepID=A0A344PL13_9RHOB|nr:hypothetical protein [Paracoccus suum]AXC50068.1 hypothetical protein DRW48_10520 [Paracoccus suum]
MAEPDLVLDVGFSASKLAASVQQVVSKYKAAGEAAQKAFQDSTGAVSNSQAARAHARELDALKRAYDPVYVATKKYEAEVQRLNLALKNGAIGSRLYAEHMKRATVEMGTAAGIIQKTTARAQGGADGFRNLGFQVQDFAVQVGAGTSASQALAQQLPQLLSGFGALGIGMGTAAAILIPVGRALIGLVRDTDTLEESLKALTTSTDDMVASAENASRPIYELQTAFGGLADEIARADQAQAMFARIRAENDLSGAAKKVGQSVGYDTSPQPVKVWTGSGYTEIEAASIAQQADAMDNLREKTGATVPQVEALSQAMKRLATANSASAYAKEAANLQIVLSDIAGNAKLTEGQMENLNTLVVEAGAIRTQAERQVAAVMGETQKIIDKFAGKTRELMDLARQKGVVDEQLEKARKSGNTALVAQLEEVALNIDVQIEKTRELGRVSDEVFAQMAKAINSTLGASASNGLSALSDKLANMGAPFATEMATVAKEVEAANQSLRELIKLKESGGNYNATLDNGQWTGGPKDLINMTLNEVRALQNQMLANPANRAKYGNGKGSSALGAYQIVGQTLESLIKELGLTGNELYDQNMQDRMADQLIRRRRGQGLPGLRNEWTSLHNVGDPIIERAMGAQSTPLIDPEVAAKRKKDLDEEIQRRKQLADQVTQYAEQLSSSYVTQQKQAEEEKKRADAVARINASNLSEADKAAAIAEVNGEMQKQLTIFALMEEAKRRQVSLDAMMTDGSMTYKQAIEALGEGKKQQIIIDQQVQSAQQKAAETQEFWNGEQRKFQDGLVDAIVAGASFSDMLKSIAQDIAKAALQAALFGQGPMSSGGGGLLSGLFSMFGGGGAVRGNDALSQALRGAIGFRASGGPINAGAPYVVGERGPELIVPRLPGTVIPNHRLGGRSSNTITFAPVIHANGAVSQTDLDMAKRQMAEFMHREFVPMLRQSMPEFNARYA